MTISHGRRWAAAAALAVTICPATIAGETLEDAKAGSNIPFAESAGLPGTRSGGLVDGSAARSAIAAMKVSAAAKRASLDATAVPSPAEAAPKKPRVDKDAVFGALAGALLTVGTYLSAGPLAVPLAATLAIAGAAGALAGMAQKPRSKRAWIAAGLAGAAAGLLPGTAFLGPLYRFAVPAIAGGLVGGVLNKVKKQGESALGYVGGLLVGALLGPISPVISGATAFKKHASR